MNIIRLSINLPTRQDTHGAAPVFRIGPIKYGIVGMT
jgi:hypothetical protein